MTASLVVCGLAGCGTLASPADYAAYRAYRYEPDGPDRFAAGTSYLQRFPQGKFHARVQDEVLGAEEDFWADHRTSVDSLHEYLRAFPTGNHVDEARQRIGVFEAARRAQEEARRAAAQAEAERNAAELARQSVRQRLWTRITYAHWLRVFGGLQGWGQGFGAIVGLNPDFNDQFEVRPDCHGAHCRMNTRVDFSIPVPGRTALTNAVTFTLDMVRVGPERAVDQVFLTVHNKGLSHWWESEHQQPLDPADAAARESSVRWAMEQLKAEFVAIFPTARETPAALYGPPPEAVMEGAGDDDDNATPPPTDPHACVIPSQPLGTRWSAVIGCGTTGGAQISATPEAVEAHAHSLEGNPPAPSEAHACLRIDAYGALDGEGMSTDEGMVISLIPPCALTQPAHPARGAHPVVQAPARPPMHLPVPHPPVAAPSARPPGGPPPGGQAPRGAPPVAHPPAAH